MPLSPIGTLRLSIAFPQRSQSQLTVAALLLVLLMLGIMLVVADESAPATGNRLSAEPRSRAWIAAITGTGTTSTSINTEKYNHSWMVSNNHTKNEIIAGRHLLSSSPCLIANAEPVQLFPNSSVLPVSTLCPPGFLCTNLNQADPATYPVACPPTSACAAIRLQKGQCTPQGTFEPSLCPQGFYCPAFNRGPFECPAGYYCIYGTQTPAPCDSVSYCPAGSIFPRFYGGFLWIGLFDLLLLGLYFVQTFESSRRHKTNESPASALTAGSTATDHAKPSVGTNVIKVISPSAPPAESVPAGSLVLSAAVPSFRSPDFQVLRESFLRRRQESQVKSLEFSFSDLSLELPKKLGGKTTLLSVLLDKVDSSWSRGGSLLINGEPSRASQFKHAISYLPQDDILHSELTVYDNIAYAAAVKLPANWSRQDREKHINALISVLGLSGIEHSVIGDGVTRGISGGQRKRVSLGIALAGAPLVMFGDEPTSGLDSSAALSVCELLRELCFNAGITVAIVLHQPRYQIFSALDTLLLLAPGGSTVYEGKQELLFRYFSEFLQIPLKADTNPANQVMDEIADHAESFTQKWKNGGQAFLQEIHAGNQLEAAEDTRNGHFPQPSAPRDDITDARGARFLTQIWLSFWRALQTQHALFSLFILELVVDMVVGGVLALGAPGHYQGVYITPFELLSSALNEGSTPQMFLFMGIALSLTAAAAGVQVYANDIPVYFRETTDGHSPLAWFIGVEIAQLPRLFYLALHFTFIYHLITTPLIPFNQFLLFVFLLFWVYYGLSAGILFMFNASNADLIAVILGLIFTVFDGYVGVIPVGVTYLSGNFWAAEAMFYLQTREFVGVMQVGQISAPAFHYNLNQVGLDAGLMIVVGVVWRMIAFSFLRLKNRKEQR